jgi:hypothetical protein
VYAGSSFATAWIGGATIWVCYYFWIAAQA